MSTVTGYRELSSVELNFINQVKESGEEFRELFDVLRQGDPAVDQRWLAIAETHFQQGFMALVRAIAKPTTFA